jgi:hypothetical protein
VNVSIMMAKLNVLVEDLVKCIYYIHLLQLIM